jgi:catechol 2,3-dioxygenase-like lactoylglutathione lyase family enzyme
MSSIRTAAPQFLVDEITKALSFYEERLGFNVDFVYQNFYASVSRDGATIHLKCAPKLVAERELRKSGEHLDAYLDVSGVDEFHEELTRRGVQILRSLTQRPWGRREFYIEDPDGYILCFSEEADS